MFNNQICTLLNTVNDIGSSLTNTNDKILTPYSFFGEVSLDILGNTLIPNGTVNYIKSTNRFQISFL